MWVQKHQLVLVVVLLCKTAKVVRKTWFTTDEPNKLRHPHKVLDDREVLCRYRLQAKSIRHNHQTRLLHHVGSGRRALLKRTRPAFTVGWTILDVSIGVVALLDK